MIIPLSDKEAKVQISGVFTQGQLVHIQNLIFIKSNYFDFRD